jgi:hypothetical protein
VISIDFTGFDLFAFPLLHILRAALARGRAYGGSRYKTGPLPARLGADAEKVPAAASRAGGHRPAHRDMAALDLAAAALGLRRCRRPPSPLSYDLAAAEPDATSPSPPTLPPSSLPGLPPPYRPRRRRRPRRYLRRPRPLVAAPGHTVAARPGPRCRPTPAPTSSSPPCLT